MLALKADAGRIILEERNNNNHNFKTTSGNLDEKVASSENGSGDNAVSGDDSHRVFPELNYPNQPIKSNPGRRG